MTPKRVVITGIGLITPFGLREKTWAAVRAGQSAIGPLVEPEFQGLEVRIGGRCAEVPDPRGFREDRVVTLAMAAVDEAWRDGGMSLPHDDGYRTGCAVGCSKGGLQYFLNQHARMLSQEDVSPFAIPAFFPSSPNSYIANHLHLRGPFSNAVGACATGLLCAIDGVSWIRSGRCDAALVGSTDASLLPLILSGFDRLGVLSRMNDRPHEACRPFDISRDGFAVSEGAAVLLLESLDSARQRHARMYGEVLGWGAGSFAYEILSLPQDGSAIAEVIRVALDRAKITPDQVDVVSAHGTGTLLNDRVETAALKQVFGPHAYKLSVTASKSMLGHLLGACASAELCIAILAMRDGFVPPTINLSTPDPQCDLDYVPRSGRAMRIRNILKLSFGFGGHIAALVVGRPPEPDSPA